MTTLEDVKAKLSELKSQAASLPEGPGRAAVLSRLDHIESTIDSLTKRLGSQDTAVHA